MPGISNTNPLPMTEKNDRETHNDIEPDDDQELGSPMGFIDVPSDYIIGSSQELGQASDIEDVEGTTREDEETKASDSVEMKKKMKALMEFRCRVEDAIVGNYLFGKPSKKLSQNEVSRQKEQLKEINLRGVPLLPSKGHQGTDVVLKFLRARDFKVSEALDMQKRTLKWQKEFKADEILEEQLGGSDLQNVMFTNSTDKEGHPLCYTVYGPFKDRELYKKKFRSGTKCKEFLRWKIQFMEKGIKKLNFTKGGVDSMVQITDLKNSPGPDLKELRSHSTKTQLLLQNNYPELIQKNIVINAPLWYYALHVLQSRFLSHRTKKKLIFARPSNVTKTLLKVIEPEELPVHYGGLKREKDDDFTPEDRVSEITVRGNTTSYNEIPVAKGGLTMVWDLTVVGWDVWYNEEFVPDDEGSYKILSTLVNPER